MVRSLAEIEAEYGRRRDAYAAAEQSCAARDRWVTHLRTVTFLLGALLLALGWLGGHQPGWYAAGGFLLAVFFGLVTYHEYLLRQLERHRILRQINQQAIARLNRDWRNLPEMAVDVPPRHQAVASDLDLFGHASVFQLICVANTPIGQQVLRDWLLEPASPAEIRLRHQAVGELAARVELRETLNVEGRLLGDRGGATRQFVEWAESRPWLGSRPWLLWLCRLLPLAGLLAAVMMLAGAGSAEMAGLILLGVLLMNVLISVLFLADVHDIFTLLNARGGKVRGYLQMFQLMYALPDSTGELDAIKREATHLGGGVLLRLRELSFITSLAGISRSALLFIFVYLPLQLLVLYDFHVLNLLEIWQRKYGGYARGWFVALGKFEALASLANLVHDQPDWILPDVAAAAERFEAAELGHPLLPTGVRVDNDVVVGPPGTFLLVTGSNMSGKSTLLRAIGVNAVLAQAGGPVCARRLTMPPLVLGTSMRVRDSLEFGVSFYMAELMRLKEIVDLASSLSAQGPRLLYLLDEILQGTNSRERHIAVVRVLQHLLGQGAVGAVSTHDLELAGSPVLKEASLCVHFRETLHDRDAAQPMTFDYRLRPGVATTTNALKLLEIVGLG